MFVKPKEEYVLNRESGIDSRRSAIAMIEHVTFEDAEAKVEKILIDAGIPYIIDRWHPLGKPVSTTFSFMREEPVSVHGGKSYFPSVFIERAVTGHSERFHSIESEDTFIVWISFVIKRKELTKWRRKLIPLFVKKQRLPEKA